MILLVVKNPAKLVSLSLCVRDPVESFSGRVVFPIRQKAIISIDFSMSHVGKYIIGRDSNGFFGTKSFSEVLTLTFTVRIAPSGLRMGCWVALGGVGWGGIWYW